MVALCARLRISSSLVPCYEATNLFFKLLVPGVYKLENTLPPWWGGGNITQCHFGEELCKGEERNGENVKEKGRKQKEKGRKGKENEKRGSKSVK